MFYFFEFYFIFLYNRFLLVIYFIHISVYMSTPISKFIPLPPTPPPHFPHFGSTCLLSTSVFLFLPCSPVHLYHFSRFHIYMLIYDICFSLSDLLHSVWQSLGRSTSLQWPNFIPFYDWVIFHCIYVPLLLYPFICRWAFRLLPWCGYCNSAAMNIGVHVYLFFLTSLLEYNFFMMLC